MSIEQTLDQELKDAMRAHDKPKVQCIRQVRSKVQEAVNGANFTGPVDDALYGRVIGAYSKQLEKSMAELHQGGERGAALVAQYQAEVSYLKRFLPKPVTDEALQAWLAAYLAEHGPIDPRQGGKVLGAMMKAHAGTVEPKRGKMLVELALRGAGGTTP